MIRISRILAGAVLLILLNAFATRAQHDFRGVDWGMNIQAVKTKEAAKLVTEEPTRLIYEGKLADIKGQVFYTFTQSKHLMRGKYYLTPDYKNLNFYIRDYNLIRDVLTKKYGEPVRSTISTFNRQTMAENEWPLHLASGNLRIENVYETPTTIILLTMSKVGDKPAIQVDYISKEFDKKDLEDKKSTILKDL